MEEKSKSKNKHIMESPYDIEIESLNQEKSISILKSLLGVIETDKSLKPFLFNHDEIVDFLEHGELQAAIIIRTTQYEKFYKHVPIIARARKINFVLIEQEYMNTVEFSSLPDTSLIGIRQLNKKDEELSIVYEKVESLVSLINLYHVQIAIPYLFSHPHYINTKFRVEKIKGKRYAKHLSRKEKKQIKKSLKKRNV
ncbi:hypothetical protein PGO_072610 [Plasmodium gonderi]|uniref:Uncharacterized protein n=1 Tax=Plasmodium gonderi TaxID=77519 RepID=A0A1Y1JCX3_PLAGO|nr:hypothetical protein PGO_072610 [Plasmodium gonderi]GAW80346.1 hypothetical protein PGO_072610 [Plasmodium gonderi]